EDDGPAADVAAADDDGLAHAGLGLFGDEALVVGDAVAEAERVAGDDVGEPLLEAVLVEQLLDALGGGQVEVVAAVRLGADVEPGDLLLGEDGRLALRAGGPKPFGDAAPRAVVGAVAARVAGPLVVAVGVHAPSGKATSTVYDTGRRAARQGAFHGRRQA